MEAERDEPQRHQGEQHVAQRFARDRRERRPKAVRIAGVVMQPCNQDEDPDDPEDDSPRDHAEATEAVDRDPLRAGHLIALQILAESGLVGIEELAEPAEDADDAGDDHDHVPRREL